MIVDIDISKLTKEEQKILNNLIVKAKAKKYCDPLDCFAYREAEFRIDEYELSSKEKKLVMDELYPNLYNVLMYGEDMFDYELFDQLTKDAIKKITQKGAK